MAAVVAAVHDSPIKPEEVAMEPAEDAHDLLEAKQKGLNLKDENKDIDEVDGDISRPDVLIITEMIKEEQELEKEGEQEEEKIKQEHDKEVDGDISRPDVLIITEMIKEEQELEKEGEQEEEKIKQEHDKEVDGDTSRPDVLIITEMIKEEQELEKEGEQEEEKIKQEHDKIWKDLDDEDRENRYKKLQFLLSKSNMYTQYLLSRMEKQKMEYEKKAERIQKRKEKEAKKKQVEEKTQGHSNNTERKVSLTADVSMEEKNVMSPVSTPTGSLMSPSTRGGSKPGTPNSQDSHSQDSKKGKKRKADSAANSPNITNFFKKQKTEDLDIQKGESVDQEVICQENKENYTDAAETDSGREPVDNKTSSEKKDDDLSENEEDDEKEDSGVPKMFTGGELRKYQLEGYSWLKCLYENGVNGILADEMGLGKTVQCIAMMAHLVNMGVPGPYLVVAPLSTLPNWQSEFERFAPKVPVVLYHGNMGTRTKLRRKIFKRCKIRSGIEVRPVVITSYEITIRDRKLLQNFEWRYLIVDEGHRIKNTHCRLIRELRLYKNTHRLLLTGTPLQNNLAELWSLLNFLLPEIFDDLGSFETWLDVERITGQDADKKIVQEEQQKNILSMLHQILTPFMLRRLKEDVDLNIPPKKEVLVYAPLSTRQSEFYEATVNRTIFQKLEEKNMVKETPELDERGRPVRKLSKKKVNYALMLATDKDLNETPKKGRFIQKDEEEIESWVQAIIDNQEAYSSKNKIMTPKTAQITVRLQNIMMQLRKCCNHPYLLEYPLTADEQYRIDEDLVTSCGKMVLLDRMLKELKRKGHKVLIFSQMTKMLDILGDYCYLRDIPYCRLDGKYSMDERKEQMDTFNNDKDMFLFLLSTRAGGLGINLTAADTVIIYDSDWNPQCDLQAQDRCHRIGQTKPVVIYRFVTANTIDQKIVERAAAKRKLEKMVIHKEKFKTGIKDYTTEFKPLTPEDLQALLKSRDHQMVMKGKDEWSNISDIDLGRILDRSDLMEKWMSKCEGKSAKAKASKKLTGGKSTKKDVLFKVIDDDDVESVTEEDIKELTEKVKLS